MTDVYVSGAFQRFGHGYTIKDGGGATWTYDPATNSLSVALTVASGSVADHAITNVKLAQMADSTVKGRAAGAGTGDATDLTVAQLKALLSWDLAAFRATDATSVSNTLTADASLTLTFTETGSYAVEIWLPFYEAILGTGGFQFDINSGSSTIGTVVFGVDGFATAVLGTAGVTSVSTATASGTIATSASAPSWYLAKGYMQVTAIGTRAVRWAQNSASANATTLMTGAYFRAKKIG